LSRIEIVRNYFLALTALALTFVWPVHAVAQNAQATTAPSSPQAENKFGSPAVWSVNPDFLKAAHAACDKSAPPTSVPECFIGEMAKAGAPQDAVKFTRALYGSTGQVGMMGEFKSFGAIGLAWVVYPLRANENDGLLLLNGDPQFLDPDDVQKLDKTALPSDPLFLQWKKTAPKLDVWPGDRAGGAAQIQFARVRPGEKPGSQRFLFSYPLIDGCHACARSGFANYWWDFDAQGKFLGTQLLSVTRGAPPIKRGRVPPAGNTPTPATGTPPAAGETSPDAAPATPH
jgi:hypothetical protein